MPSFRLVLILPSPTAKYLTMLGMNGILTMLTSGYSCEHLVTESTNTYSFSLSISAGDTIAVSVASTSTKAGTAVITNTSTGKSVSKSLTSTYALGGQNAEWIVEDFEENGSLVKLCNFGTVTFTSCVAKTSSSSENAASASILDIKQSSVVLTSVTVSGSTVTVSYV